MSFAALRRTVVAAGVTALALAALAAPVGIVPAGGAAPPAATAAAVPAAAAPADRPNVVVVMADDMRVDDLRYAPTIRRLLGEGGLTFANSFSPYPLCCPARASFLTGQYTHNHEVYDTREPYGYGAFDDSRTVATSLRRAGYRTGFVGKYLNGYGPHDSLVTGAPSATYVPRGWDEWAAAIENPGRTPGVKRVRGGVYHYFRTPFNVNGRLDVSRDGDYQTNIVGDLSRDMATRFSRSRAPFFLSVNYVAPHHGKPFEPDDPASPGVQGDGADDGFSTPARPDWVKGRFDDLITRAPGMPANGEQPEQDVSDKPVYIRSLPEVTPSEARALTLLTRQRAESVFVMDREVGRLVKNLKRSGEWADTVMVFTSDNGYFLGEHRMRTGKVRPHEPSLRVPLLVAGPGVRSGETSTDPISTVDLTATILDVAGARAPVRQDGRSLWPTMRSGDQGWSSAVVTEGTRNFVPKVPPLPENPDGDPATPRVSTRRDPSTLPRTGRDALPGAAARAVADEVFGPDDPRTTLGLRTSRYSFSLYRNGEGELYDLVADGAQLENLYVADPDGPDADPRYADVQRELLELLTTLKDCRGAACGVALPEDLRASAEQNAANTDAYEDAVRRHYDRP